MPVHIAAELKSFGQLTGDCSHPLLVPLFRQREWLRELDRLKRQIPGFDSRPLERFTPPATVTPLIECLFEGHRALSMNQPRKALTAYRQARALAGDDPLIGYSLGVAACELGEDREAVGHFRRAIDLGLDSPDVWNNLAIALVRSGQPEQAWPAMLRAVDLAPDHRWARYNLAWLACLRGDEARARAETARIEATPAGRTLADRLWNRIEQRFPGSRRPARAGEK